MTVSAPAQKGVDVESGPAPAHPLTEPLPLTEPGRITVQLLVASSAVLALIQLVAATSVEVYNGERAGWWVAIQGATVAFAAAFAGAAAGANGAWWRRMQQKSSSTTAASLGTAVAAAGVAGAVFAMLCWASSSLGNATYPMCAAVLVAALLGGVAGGGRAGGAILAGLVSTFVATLVNLAGQALTTLFALAPAVYDGTTGRGGTPLGVSAVTWAISTVIGTLAGVWWLSHRRRYTTIVHCLIIALYPVGLILIGDAAELLAWVMVSDPAKGDALKQAATSHAVQLAVMFAAGLVTALISSRALRTRRTWPVRPRWLRDDPAARRHHPTQLDTPAELEAHGPGRTPNPAQPAEWRPTTGIPVPPPASWNARNGADPSAGRPATSVRAGNGVVRGGLMRLIPTQQRRDEASKS